jgi:hypothetical protein
MRVTRRWLAVAALLASVSSAAQAQNPPGDHAGHDMSAMESPTSWMTMYDGVLFGTFNHQGGPRGGDDVESTNWLMTMASRPAGPGVLQITGMFSLDPATTGADGYRELFQVGETYHGAPLVDRQHPHDLLMQASLAWRVPLNAATALTLSGAPVGEPALGPTAFMHRASAAENVAAPLAHHTLDSTHISMGVITAGLERGPWTFESSIFHGGEPDDNRWDLMDPGALDSWSVRGWFHPTPTWQFQVSHGFLTEPEALEPGNLRRTTASAEWFRPRADGFSAASIAFGRNNTAHGSRNALLLEATERRRSLTLFTRVETLQVETAILAGDELAVDEAQRDVVSAFTVGTAWDLATIRRLEIAVGGDVTFYAVPDALQPSYSRPTSFHIFLRIRPVSAMGRMWNMRMGRVSVQDHAHGNHAQP